MLGKSRPHNTPKRPTVQKSIGTILALALVLSACASLPIERVVRKEIRLIFDPTDSPLPMEEAGKLFFATQGAIEAQLPVRVTVLDPQIDNFHADACVVRFASSMEIWGLGWNVGRGSNGAASWNGSAMYPCQVLLSKSVTDLEELRAILQHEAGHILLNQEHHSDDPTSIMTGGVSKANWHRFTAKEAAAMYTSDQQ